MKSYSYIGKLFNRDGRFGTINKIVSIECDETELVSAINKIDSYIDFLKLSYNENKMLKLSNTITGRKLNFTINQSNGQNIDEIKTL